MRIYFKNKSLKIEKTKFPLKTEYFIGSYYLIKTLNEKGVNYLKDLPKDLSELLLLEGIGEKTVEKFYNQIALLEKTISDTGYIVYKEKALIPVTMFSVPVNSFLVQTNPLMMFFNDVDIKKVGELPSDLTVLNKIKQIGPVTVKKLVNELLCIKKTHEKQKVFALKDRNIFIPKTFDLSVSLSEFAKFSSDSFYSLDDLPTDLRPFEEEPKFEVFINNLEDAITQHKQEMAIKEFRNTFDSLLKGQSVIEISERNAQVIKYRFSNPEMPSLQKIGDKMGLSRERIRQIINLVIVKVYRHYRGSFLFAEDIIERSLHEGEREFLKAFIDKDKCWRKRKDL